METSENIFRGYRNGKLALNGLYVICSLEVALRPTNNRTLVGNPVSFRKYVIRFKSYLSVFLAAEKSQQLSRNEALLQATTEGDIESVKRLVSFKKPRWLLFFPLNVVKA